MTRVLLVALFVATQAAVSAPEPLSSPSAELFAKARTGKFFSDAERLKPEILPMNSAAGFLAVWRATTNPPTKWIVSLHGSEGFATDDLAIWSRHLNGRNLGLVCVQWWLGKDGSMGSYLRPEQIYREVDAVLQRLRAQPGTVMLHGFSRGAANAYAMAALDAGRGRKYFSLCVASSGGVATDYPATRAILEGKYGEHPLQGTRWITSAGGRDKAPDRDGIPAMQRTATWLQEQEARVLFRIEDPENGHGALMLNPANVQRVLDEFTKDP